jgi:hypothetical protein
MKPVMQNTLGRRGNCMSACLASILEVPLATVPNFYELAGEGVGEWWAAVRAWLKPFGFGVITLTFTDAAQWDQLCLDGYHIVSGASPRIEGSFHATVWHGGRMVHDPHPDQSGIVAPETLDMLYPLNAGALRTDGVGGNDA